jgi:hypothetical protein
MVDPCKEDCYHPQSHHYPPPGESSSGDSGPTLSKVISATGQTGSPCGPAWSTTPWAYFNRSRCLYVHGHFALRISAETVTLVVTLLAYCYPFHADGRVLTLRLCEQNLGVSHRRHYPSFDSAPGLRDLTNISPAPPLAMATALCRERCMTQRTAHPMAAGCHRQEASAFGPLLAMLHRRFFDAVA